MSYVRRKRMRVEAGTQVFESENPGEMLGGAYGFFCKPGLEHVLTLLKLDVHYTKAQGQYLFYQKNGKLERVLDLLGGYGSTILGHNPKKIKTAAIEALDQDIAIHAQGSIRDGAVLVAEKLNAMIRQELPGAKRYYVHLLNSGTEAIEAAIKHALMEWNERKKKFIFALKQKRAELLQKKETNYESVKKLENALNLIQKANPIFVAFEGSFHGKTTGSLAVTHNLDYRNMYARFPIQTEFVSREISSDALKTFLSGYSLPLSEQTHFSTIAGIFLEPMQGEGGVHVLGQEVLGSLQEYSFENSIPLIVDEIQTGIFRTGKLLLSSSLGIRPSYITLGKSLGGGVAKISALLVEESHYQEDFALKHTSTFAEDDLSSMVALKTLEELDLQKDIIAKNSQKFEVRIKTKLSELALKYPGVIADVRGRGFLIGVEFSLSSDRVSHFYDTIEKSGYLLYLYASYLLHHHRVRVGVTLNKTNTMRLEPAATVSDEDTDLALFALEDLIQKISEGRYYELFHHLIPKRLPVQKIISPPRFYIQRGQEAERLGLRRVVFLGHIINAKHSETVDPVFKAMTFEQREFFLEHMGSLGKSILSHQQIIKGIGGQKVLFELQGITSQTKAFETSIRNKDSLAFEKVHHAYSEACKRGATHVGLGQYTSIVSQNGLLLENPNPCLTTGNSLTVAMALEALKKVLRDRGQSLAGLHVGVVGAAGNICNVYGQVIGDEVREMTLIHREPLEKSSKFQAAVRDILQNSKIDSQNLHTATDFYNLQECDVVVLGTNSTKHLLLPEHLKQDALVLDISVPSNIHPDVFEHRKDVQCVQGGFAKLPLGQVFDSPIMTSPSGEMFACAAETLMLGLLNYPSHFSYGSLNKEKVLQSFQMAKEVGIELGSIKKPFFKNSS